MLTPESEVKVYFSLYGEEFPVEEVTQTMGLDPSETYQIGDLISDPLEAKFKYRKETVWRIGTEYEKTFDVKEQLDKVLNPLISKTEEIIGVKKKFRIDCQIMIVLIIEKGETPAMYLEKEHIDFASKIGAEIQWDLYANPYVSDF